MGDTEEETTTRYLEVTESVFTWKTRRGRALQVTRKRESEEVEM